MPLNYAGEVSIFETQLTLPEPGRYDLEIVAADGESVNFGRTSHEIRVRR